MSYSASSNTHTTITDVTTRKPADVPSIREICLRSIMTGSPTKEEAQALVAQHHPAAAGNTKFGRHYSWYKGWLNKDATPKQVRVLQERFGIAGQDEQEK